VLIAQDAINTYLSACFTSADAADLDAIGLVLASALAFVRRKC
jgi:hypothetical protein